MYSQSVMNSAKSAVELISKGWSVELAFDCQYDYVYDEISENDFITLIQSLIK